MRSSKSRIVFKSFKELKTLLDRSAECLPVSAGRVESRSFASTPAQNENQLFEAAMADVTPISSRARAIKTVSPSPPKAGKRNPDDEALNRLQKLVSRGEGFVVADTPEYIEGTGHMVHGQITKRLHRGDFSIQSHVDLHGLSLNAARERFEAFLSDAVKRGKRAVLIVHGRGLSSPAEPVLKTHVYQWLTRSHWRKRVIAFSSARSCDGGAGATYVLLRQRPLTKRFRKRDKTH